MTPPPNRPLRARLRRSLALAAVVALAWSGIWALAAWQTNRWADRVLADWAAAGTPTTCERRRTTGYPATLVLLCDDVTVRDMARGLSLALDGLHARTAIWQPGLVIARPAGPATLATEIDASVRLDWQSAEFGTLWRPAGLASSHVEATRFDARWSAGRLTAAQIRGRLSAAADPKLTEFTAAAEEADLRMETARIEPFSIRVQTHLDRPLADLVAGRVDPRLAPVRLPLVEASLAIGGARLELNGDAAVDTSGRVSGDLVLTITGLPALHKVIGGLPPETAQALGPLAGALVAMAAPRQKGTETVHELNLTIRDGTVRAGPLPLASIPPLF